MYEKVKNYQAWTWPGLIKNFCEDRNQSDRNDKSTFRGKSSITFFNEKTRQVVVFDRETKIFITAYKISPDQLIRYLKTGEIGTTAN